ncbi:hypothetical protein [Cohnella zeiphila]|uniref:WYL domain-containing protein n=1 Tax=Cohnella zeiphila TaxID=2761120 RepID=A0A7X0SMN6_9BACL|nr:hypothetical protein [Cohnella zeiphila]MBB6732686.1 hypothetical protein [Cohnella zeiphila]
MSIEKYVGRLVRVVYMDRSQHFSMRTIRIVQIKNGTVRAIDVEKGLPRSFRTDRILAVEPVMLHAS